MDNKKYLKWYNKIGYGSGDMAGNIVYAFLTTFVMIYLTDTAGLNAGIVGTLMMVSKIFDGFTDIIFGSLIDKTKTKMGKARPWMLWPYIGCSLMLIFTGVAAIAMSPMQGDLNALIAACSDYTYRTTGKRIDGTMYSCSSLGVKIGGGIGTALTGWLLAAGGYVANAAVQPESCINMLHFMYLWLPMILNLLITILLSRLTVEKANENWDKTHSN